MMKRLQRTLQILGFALVPLLFGVGQAWGQTPLNGGAGCANAEVVTAGTYVTTGPDAVGGAAANNCFGGAADATWYEYTPTSNVVATVSSGIDPASTDTRLSIYDGSCGALNCVASNDDIDFFAGNYRSSASFAATAGTTYYIEWDDRWDGSGFEWELTEEAIQPNDACAGAIDVTSNIGGASVTGTTAVGATADTAPTCGTGDGTGGGVWYKITGSGRDVTASLCGSGYDTRIRVFDGSCGSLNCVAGNDDDCGLQSEVSFSTTCGTEYYILVHGFDTSEGDFELELTYDTPLAALPVTSSSNTAICIGDDANLSASISGTNASYTWSNGATGANITVSPTITTTYSVTATSLCGTGNASVTVTVNPLPTPAIAVTENSAGTANDGVLCRGSSATLTASGGTGYSWNTSATTAAINVTPSPGATTYTATVTDANGCSAVTSTTLQVGPVISVAVSGTFCLNQPSTLVASAPSATAYAWSTGATTAAATITPAATTTVTYSVTVTTANGCVGTGDISPFVSTSCSGTGGGVPVLPPDPPRDLTVTGINTNTIDLEWTDATNNEEGYRIFRANVATTRNFSQIAELDAGTGTFTFRDSTRAPDTRYRYYVAPYNSGGSRSSNQAEDATFPLPPNIVSIEDGCAGGEATITVSGPHRSEQYRWFTSAMGDTPITNFDGTAFSKASYTATQTNADTATFYVSAVGVRHLSMRTPVQVVFGTVPPASIEGDSKQLSCDETITLTAAEVAGASYEWTVNGNVIGSGRTITGTQEGDYRVTVTQGICSNTSEPVSVDLNYTPRVRLNTSDNVSFCQEGVLSVQELDSAVYGWTRNGENAGVTTPEITVTESGEYVAIVTQFGCVGTSVPVTVTVDEPFTGSVDLTIDSEEVCPGTRARLTASDIPGATYNWSRDGRTVNNTGSTLETGVPGSYTVSAAINNLCGNVVSSNTVDLAVAEVPEVRLSRDEDDLILEAVDGSTFASITWTYNGEEAAQFANQSTITPTEEGTYLAIVTYANGCSTISNSFRFFEQNETGTGNNEGGTPTGTEDEVTALKLFPNPTTSNINLQIPTDWKGGAEIQLINALGQMLDLRSFTNIEQQDIVRLDLSPYAAGTYLLQVKTKDSVFVERIVKR